MSIQLIRNATMKIEYGGLTILTDPMLSDQASLPGFLDNENLVNPTSALTLAANEIMEDVDLIMVSHSHIPAEDVPSLPSDHFDPKAIDFIDKEMPLYIQPFDQAGFKRLGFNNTNAIESSLMMEGIKVTRFTGQHVDIDDLIPMIGESSGYVLEKAGYAKVLWTGDTILTKELMAAIETHKPDVIITHSGGAQLPIDAAGNKATLLLNGQDTIEIAKRAPWAKVIAVHLEALDHCPVTREDLRKLAEEAGVSDRIFIPKNGEIIEF